MKGPDTKFSCNPEKREQGEHDAYTLVLLNWDGIVPTVRRLENLSQE